MVARTRTVKAKQNPGPSDRQRKRASFLALRGTGAGLWGPRPALEVAKARSEWDAPGPARVDPMRDTLASPMRGHRR